VITDAVEEMRALEMHERLRTRRRVTFSNDARTPAEQLLVEASVYGAQAIGFGGEVDGARVRFGARTLVPLAGAACLEGVVDEALADAFVFSGTNALRFEREGMLR
jgi:hypothetical protein